MAFTIRRARTNAGDSESGALTALAFAAKRLWKYSDEQMETWRDELRISDSMLAMQPAFVCELDGSVAGFYVLTPSSHGWSLDHLWVLPELGGRGVGRALLMHARATAAANHATVIHIDADPNAEPFYVHCGARRVGSLRAPIAGQPHRIRPQLILPVA